MQLVKWPLWAKVLYGALLAYSALLCTVATLALIDTRRNGYHLKWPDLVMQTLLMLFLPSLLIAFRNPRASSGVLILLALCNAGMILTLNRSTGDGAGEMLMGSLLFLGLPAVGAATFLHRSTKWTGLVANNGPM